MRFVPFAIDGLSPRNINIGSVRDEPPPAPTFINPEINATMNRKITEVISDKRKSCFFDVKYTTRIRYLKNIFPYMSISV